jgi:alpha-L-fucosidase
VLAKPTPTQLVWQDMEIAMFIHFGPATWQNREYDDLSTPLGEINPSELDTDQWAQVAVSMGAKLMIFVAKHTGGFCWWQTDTSGYGVKETPWRGGKGDVMADLSESCRKYGLKLGVYLSPQDTFLGANLGGKTEDPSKQEAYNQIFRAQLTELLSRYGEIYEVWFDGSTLTDVGDILRQYTPNAVIFQSPYASIRWCGNEAGWCHYPSWTTVKSADAATGVATADHSDPNGDTWMPIEVDTVMVHPHRWFWSTDPNRRQKPLAELMECYYNSVGLGHFFLLNQSPDTTGLIPKAGVARAAELGEEINRRFAESIAQTSGTGDTITLDLLKPTTIDHVITMEDISQGERMREYVIECLLNGEWRQIAQGSMIGHKKIDRFEPIEASALRLRALKSVEEPIIRKLAAFHVGADDPAGAATGAEAGYKVAFEWTPDQVGLESTEIDIDLAPVCALPGQYEVVFEPLAATGGVQVESVILRHGGVDAPEFVTKSSECYDATVFTVNITGLSSTTVLRARLRSGGDRSRGKVLIRQRQPDDRNA